jgi:hypothetical protein
MNNDKLVIVEKEPCPGAEFDFSSNMFSFSGTCYPENSTEFFGPIFSRLEQHLAALSGAEVVFELRLSYFNSGSSRAFSQFFDLFEACAAAGNTVTINWCCDAEDENMIELAEDFQEDFESVNFNVVIEAGD